MNRNEEKLVTELLGKSASNDWEVAKKQWEIGAIHIGEDTCACGKKPIKFICHMRNTVTGQTAILGSTCVEKYLDIKCTHVFKDMIVVPVGRFVRVETLEFAHRLGYVNDWERDCYLSLIAYSKRRDLSEKQCKVRDKVNVKVGRLLGSVARWREEKRSNLDVLI